jgi:hypothetical protein
MIEAGWLTATDPWPMLDLLAGKVSERRLRLLACACCRRTWHLLADGRSRNAVETSERFADGLTSREALEAPGAAGNPLTNWQFRSLTSLRRPLIVRAI